MSVLNKPVADLHTLPEEGSILQRTLYVAGLDDGVTVEILQVAFAPFGDMRTVVMPKDRATGKHRGFGFIEFDEVADAMQAIQNMHHGELLGRTLTVNLAKTPSRRLGERNRPIWSDEALLQELQSMSDRIAVEAAEKVEE